MEIPGGLRLTIYILLEFLRVKELIDTFLKRAIPPQGDATPLHLLNLLAHGLDDITNLRDFLIVITGT